MRILKLNWDGELMGNHIILDYVKEHNITDEDMLFDTYCRLKFKAYLQETLRCTKKSYCSKWMQQMQRFPTANPEDIQIHNLPDVSKYESIDLEFALRRLHKKQSEVIRLHFFCGKTDLEISKEWDISRQAVNNLKRRGLKHMKKLLEDG